MVTTVRVALRDAEQAIEKAADQVRSNGVPVWVEVTGHPSRIYIVVPKGVGVRLSGYRAVQPKQLAPIRDVDVCRIPLPRKGTVAGDGVQHLAIEGENIELDWKARGVVVEKAGDAETWSAERINALETVEGVGGQVWPVLAARYAKKSESQYDPKTQVLREHAERMPGVVTRILRDPKRRLGREDRVVAVERATEVSAESFAWLMRQSGRNPEEKAQRGVMCSVRTTEYDTLENRVVRDYTVRTVQEVQRVRHPEPILTRWARDCHWTDRGLRDLGVARPQGHVQANQVLRMNPDYRRVWEARKELLDQMEKAELLWCWQGETWNELALCLFKAAMAKYEQPSEEEGWQAVIRSPIRMRRGQHEGRWIETDQQTAGIWVHLARGRVLRLLGGPPVAACRAILYEIDREHQPIGEMSVYAIPPIDHCHGSERGEEHGLGCLMVVAKTTTTEDVQPEESLCKAMTAIRTGLQEMWR